MAALTEKQKSSLIFHTMKGHAGVLSKRNKSFSKNHKYGRTCQYIAQEQTQHSAGEPKRDGRAYENIHFKNKFEYNADYAQGKAEYEMTANGAQ